MKENLFIIGNVSIAFSRAVSLGKAMPIWEIGIFWPDNHHK